MKNISNKQWAFAFLSVISFYFIVSIAYAAGADPRVAEAESAIADNQSWIAQNREQKNTCDTLLQRWDEKKKDNEEQFRKLQSLGYEYRWDKEAAVALENLE